MDWLFETDGSGGPSYDVPNWVAFRMVIHGTVMRRISSTWTWWHKKAFPVVWLGSLGLFSLPWIHGVLQHQNPATPLLIPLGLAAFGTVMWTWLVFPLVDEVWIENNDIVVLNRGREGRFPITNIVDIDSHLNCNPRQVVLTLKEPCLYGRKIVFATPFRWWDRSQPPIVEELFRRRSERDPC